MSQLTVKLSDRADALIAQLQKEIFNRRRKKVSAAGVIETLVESGAKSQSDKRFATSWKNLVSDIEKAAKVADAHGAKPANLSDEEWALVLSHRTRTPRATAKTAARRAAAKPVAKDAAKPAARKRKATAPSRSASAAPAAAKATRSRTATPKTATPKTATPKSATRKPAARKPLNKSATSTSVSTRSASSSVARRMAKAVSRLGGAAAPAAASSNGAGKPVAV